MRFWQDSWMFHGAPTKNPKAPKGSVGNSLASTGIDGVPLGCIMFHKAPRDPERCHMVPKVWKVVQGAGKQFPHGSTRLYKNSVGRWKVLQSCVKVLQTLENVIFDTWIWCFLCRGLGNKTAESQPSQFMSVCTVLRCWKCMHIKESLERSAHVTASLSLAHNKLMTRTTYQSDFQTDSLQTDLRSLGSTAHRRWTNRTFLIDCHTSSWSKHRTIQVSMSWDHFLYLRVARMSDWYTRSLLALSTRRAASSPNQSSCFSLLGDPPLTPASNSDSALTLCGRDEHASYSSSKHASTRHRTTRLSMCERIEYRHGTILLIVRECSGWNPRRWRLWRWCARQRTGRLWKRKGRRGRETGERERDKHEETTNARSNIWHHGWHVNGVSEMRTETPWATMWVWSHVQGAWEKNVWGVSVYRPRRLQWIAVDCKGNQL